MQRHHLHFDSRRRAEALRGGFVLMWVIIAIPAIVMLFAAIVDISRVWIARIELTNALEAAALSGVKTWGEAPVNNPSAHSRTRQDAVVAAAANTVTGLNAYSPTTSPADAVALVLNQNSQSGLPNSNKLTTGDIVLGQLISSGGPGFVFDANSTPVANQFGVRAQKAVRIYSIWKLLFGVALGPYDIKSDAVAIYDGQPRIVHVVTYIP